MVRKFILPNEVVVDNKEVISNVKELDKVGAGVDGILFRHNDKVLKILKDDFSNPNTYNLSMNYDKVLYFKDNLHLSRITNPTGVLYNVYGKYIGYTMDYLDDVVKHSKKNINDFTCEDLNKSIIELQNDFDKLNKNKIVAQDINTGSYIFTKDFLHLCDMDRYIFSEKTFLNKSSLNFIVAKLLYLEITKLDIYDKPQLRKLSRWVKSCSKSSSFLEELENETYSNKDASVLEFVSDKTVQILGKRKI